MYANFLRDVLLQLLENVWLKSLGPYLCCDTHARTHARTHAHTRSFRAIYFGY